MIIAIDKQSTLTVLNNLIAWYQAAQMSQGQTFNVSDLEDMIGKNFPLSEIYQLSHNIRNAKTLDPQEVCDACSGTGKLQVIEIHSPGADMGDNIFFAHEMPDQNFNKAVGGNL